MNKKKYSKTIAVRCPLRRQQGEMTVVDGELLGALPLKET
jgi:hypothetical protein